MRVEIQVQSSHLQWWKKKKERGTIEIDCEALFKDYVNTTAHGFSVPGQLESPTSPFIANREDTADIDAGKHSYSLELQFSAEVTVRLLTIVRRRLLILFAQTDSLRSSLLKLANMLKDYSPPLNEMYIVNFTTVNTPHISPHVSPRNVVIQGPVKFT